MEDNVLSLHSRRLMEQEAGATEAEAVSDLVSFGFLRGIRDFARILELRKKTGVIRAISYAWIEEFDFDPSTGIVLRARGQTIRIKGRNLNGGSGAVRLFEGICRHRVPWVRETDRAVAMNADVSATVVEAIEW